LFSFGRGGGRDGDGYSAPQCAASEAATACLDTEAERALFEARQNTVLNVELVREMAATLP
jgi:hypothetical protein